MTKLWHCTPSEYEQQREYDIALAKTIWSLEQKQKDLDEKRENIRNKAKNGNK